MANAYTCNIKYSAPGETPFNIVSCEFVPPLPSQNVVNPGDTITFNFIPKSEPLEGYLNSAVLVVDSKGHGMNAGTPFFNNANNIDLCCIPTVTIGNNPGGWGFIVAFSMYLSEPGRSYFYYLPDPELTVKEK